MVRSDLVSGHTRTAAAHAGLHRYTATRSGRRRRALGGKHGGKLAARADVELGEDLAQVVGDGGAADEQLLSDFRVGGALRSEAGDQRFLSGQAVARLGG